MDYIELLLAILYLAIVFAAPFIFKVLCLYAAIFGAPYFVWCVVRWFNDHDAPRHPKRHFDAP